MKEISKYGAEYLDEVVFDLIYFLNQSMNSNEKKVTGYSRLPYPRTASLDKLYDMDQFLLLYGVEDEYDMQIHLLDKNKLLLISSKGPDYEFDLSTYFWFAILADASNYVLRTIKEDNGKTSFAIDNGKGQVLKYSQPSKYYPNELPNEVPITKLLRPLSLEQLYERGHVRTLVKERKQRTKKKSK